MGVDMSVLVFALLAATPGDDELDLAAALARRGWVDLAEELCGRAERNPAAKAGVPLVMAEVALAKARKENDVLKAAREIDQGVERLTRGGRALSIDERSMTGWLLTRKASILGKDAAALKAWEDAEAFFR